MAGRVCIRTLLLCVAGLLIVFVVKPYFQLALGAKVKLIGSQNKSRPFQKITSQDAECDGAVASESSVCSRVGINIIAKGGNAADATIATTFCIGVVAMYHGGIVGGGFALVRASNGSYEIVDFREAAPAAAYEDMFRGHDNYFLRGGLASAIPGELRGLDFLHKQYATLQWKSLIEPSIKLAREGFKVTDDLVDMMEVAIEGRNNFLVEDPVWSIDFAPNGKLLQAGDIITRKRYRDTLSVIADNGPKAFYRGELGQATIAALRSNSGIMTLEDLRDYRIRFRKAVEIKYRDFRIVSGGAPAGGIVALSALKILEK